MKSDPKTFCLIDNHSGFYWGHSKSETVEEAIRNVEIDINGTADDIGEIFEGTFNDTTSYLDRATYHVYRGDSLSDEILEGDGQDSEIIETIASNHLCGTWHRTHKPY